MSNAPKTKQELFAYLDALSISYTNHEHEPVFTVEEAQKVRQGRHGGHTKNLFLKDKKSRYFLLTLGENAQVELKHIHKHIGAQGRVSFGNADALMQLLGVTPGSVSAFCLLNDSDQQVTFYLDASLMNHETIYAHPLLNDATTAIARDDLLRFIEATGHTPHLIDLEKIAASAD